MLTASDATTKVKNFAFTNIGKWIVPIDLDSQNRNLSINIATSCSANVRTIRQ